MTTSKKSGCGCSGASQTVNPSRQSAYVSPKRFVNLPLGGTPPMVSNRSSAPTGHYDAQRISRPVFLGDLGLLGVR